MPWGPAEGPEQRPEGRIDRALQRSLLETLRAAYPQRTDVLSDPIADQDQVVANLIYLEEHGLCEAGIHWNLSGNFSYSRQKITARGIDFLEQDGGLSAILGTVTVRFQAETLRDMIAARIDAADIPEEQKPLLKRHLASLSETGLKVATTDLVQSGLHHLPDAIGWLQRFVGL